jgi:glutamyl-tRNA synthetase
MPKFAHLPLILKPTGQGKLSKRDGSRLGIPVFPLSWNGETAEESFVGFREFGFDPRAVVNFLAFLGWNPGTEQEMFSMEELIQAFSIEKIGKSGARFDFEKAKWFNQQYLIASDNAYLANLVRPIIEKKGHNPAETFLQAFCGMMKERVVVLTDFWENGHYFFEDFTEYDDKTIGKKWNTDSTGLFTRLLDALESISNYDPVAIQAGVEGFISENGLKFGDIFPILRVGLTGTVKGPGVFDMMALWGKTEVKRRLERSFALFNQQIAKQV